MNISIQYGDHVVDFAKVPEASVKALLQRGVAHLLGNEQAAKVSGYKVKKASENALADSQSAEAIAKMDKADLVKNYGPGDDEVESVKARLVSEALADIYAGDIGQGRGAAIDPIEREMRSAIDAHIANVLAGAGIKFAKGRKLPIEDEVVTFANDQTRTLEQMRENTRKTHGDRMKKEAERRVADLAKKAATSKAQAEALAKAGAGDAESLGL